MPILRSQFDEYSTEFLLEHSRKELTPQARAVVHALLAERGVGTDAIAAAIATPPQPSPSDRAATALQKPVGPALATAATLAWLIFAGWMMYGMLTVGIAMRPAARLWKMGDADAAIYAMLAVCCFFGAGCALTAVICRRLGVFGLLGGTLALLYCAIEYRFFPLLAAATVFAGAVGLLLRRRHHAAPLPRWLAGLVSIPVYALAVTIAARMLAE